MKRATKQTWTVNTQKLGRKKQLLPLRKVVVRGMKRRKRSSKECCSCRKYRRRVVQGQCGHNYCANCLDRMVSFAVAGEARIPLMCCSVDVGDAKVLKAVSATVRMQYSEAVQRVHTMPWYVPPWDLFRVGADSNYKCVQL
jgi:hypothetical protein